MPDLSAIRISRDDEHSDSGTRKRRWWRIGWGLAGLALLLLGGYVAMTVAYRPIEVTLVTVNAVSHTISTAIMTASGYVVAQRQASVASKGTGRLEYLGVREGNTVRESQVIARLEHADIDAALAEAQAHLVVAQAALLTTQSEHHDATRTYHRQQALFTKGMVSQARFDVAEARYKAAQAGITSAHAAILAAQHRIQALETELEYTNIRAPFHGTVIETFAEVGEIVAPLAGASSARGSVVSIADLTSLEVEVDVSESHISRIHPGQTTRITLDAFPDRPYQGEVRMIIPTADRAKATIQTNVRFLDLDQRVLPEMTARVDFLGDENRHEPATPIVAAPKAAIVLRDGQQIALTAQVSGAEDLGGKDTIVMEVPVEIGRELGGGMIEITSGLSVGDRIVLNPPDHLQSGSRIRLTGSGRAQQF